MFLKLEELCLEAIAENFETYNSVFTATQDEAIKRQFEFLQRKYSFDMVERVFAKQDLPEEYIDLLVNKHLKVLKTSWLRECSWEKIASKIAEIGSNVEQITFGDEYFEKCHGSTPWEDIICHLPNLKSFIYHFKYRHDTTLKNVAKFCPCIEEIEIKNSTIYEGVEYFKRGIKFLCKDENGRPLCTQLKKLSIVDTRLVHKDLMYLLKKLPSLDIKHPDIPLVLYSLHKNDLLPHNNPAVEPYKITFLNFDCHSDSEYHADVLKVCLNVCPYLKSLIFILHNEDELNLISNISDLEYLCLRNSLSSRINVNNVLKLRGEKLTFLLLQNFTVSVSLLVESCPRVEKLILSEMRLELFDDGSKPVFNSLVSLTLQRCNLSQGSRAINWLLLSAEKLESLAFEACEGRLTDEIKFHIFRCCELHPIRRITFSFSQIEKEYIKHLLLNCRKISYLNIERSFCKNDLLELLTFADFLSNKPIIDFRERSTFKHMFCDQFNNW